MIQQKKHILSVMDILREQAKTASEHVAKLAEIEASEAFSETYKQEQVTELRSNYIDTLINTKLKVNEVLEKIINTEKIQESMLELDIPEFSNTISLINVSGENMSDNTIIGIIENFKGKYLILQEIKNVFSGKYGKDITKLVDKDIFDSVDSVMTNIATMVSNIDQTASTSLRNICNIMQGLIHFGETRGLIFNEYEADFGEAKEIDLAEMSMEDYIKARNASK